MNQVCSLVYFFFNYIFADLNNYFTKLSLYFIQWNSLYCCCLDQSAFEKFGIMWFCWKKMFISLKVKDWGRYGSAQTLASSQRWYRNISSDTQVLCMCVLCRKLTGFRASYCFEKQSAHTLKPVLYSWTRWPHTASQKKSCCPRREVQNSEPNPTGPQTYLCLDASRLNATLR